MWSEIINDYIEEYSNGVLELNVDAFLTNDTNECGEVIATIFAQKIEGEVKTKIEYNNELAKSDNYAQRIISEGIEILKSELQNK